MRNKSLIKAIKNPYVFSIISKITLVMLGFIYSVCQSRYLGAALKGDVAYITSITSITSIIFGCGVHQAYPYFKKKTGEDVAPLFMKLSVLMMVIYLAVAGVLTLIMHLDFSLGAVFILTPCLVYTKIVAYINMVENPNKKNITELIVSIIEVIIVVGFWLKVPASIYIGIFIFAVKDLILAIIYTYRMRVPLLESVEFSVVHCQEIFRFGIFPMLILLMTTLNYRVDIIMLKQFVTSTDVGIYSVGVMLAERVWVIPDAMKEVMISNLAKGKGIEEVSFVIRVCNLACIIVVVGIILLGQPFINLFYGVEYAPAYSVTVVILIGVVFMVYYKTIGAYNIVEGKQKDNFIYLVISVICNLVLNIILIPRFGNLGAAIASIFSYAVSAGLFTRKFVYDNNVNIKDMLLPNQADLFRLRQAISKNI